MHMGSELKCVPSPIRQITRCPVWSLRSVPPVHNLQFF
ncbi:hypothetical protein AG1IA_09010 [Rhizoctonia solani AG-1 IA]|uniref:Uncharacterized protein n=1 Tax=Thanatephorus cucumeris (strain AG1-IA) TaxID=983506 RepID=L8WG67_THACA|nr:hypothetical protein AG1IA_09010 [Rhizoctonia solani AG-1 IA]